MDSQLLELEGSINFMELGGYVNREGKVLRRHKLLRADRMNILTDSDIQFLQNYGITAVVDLRGEQEAKDAPNRIIPGAEYVKLPVHEEEGQKSPMSEEEMLRQMWVEPIEDYDAAQKAFDQHMIQGYRRLAADPHAQETFRRFFRLLCTRGKDQGALVFHCAMGKDRTGFAAALILTALGFTEETIMEDYLLTNKCVDRKFGMIRENFLRQGASEESISYIHNMMLAKQAYLETAYDTVRRMSGSMDAYLEEVLGVVSRDRELLAGIYLESYVC